MGIGGISDRMKVEAGRVEVRGGGGCLSAVGILFLLAGCGAIAAFAFGDSLADDNTWVFAVVGLMCILPGVVLTFGRYTLLIDGNTRTYRKRFSVLLAIKETGGSLDEFDKVVISRRVRRHDQKTYIDFPIQLDGTAKPLEIAVPGTIQNARRDAEQVAKALRLALADHTGPTQIEREAEHLDESLRERRQRTSEHPGELPPVPEGMKTQCRIEGDEVVLMIPPKGCTFEAFGYLISWAVLLPGLAFFLFRPFRELAAGADSAKPVFVVLVMVVSIFAGVVLLLRSLRRSDTIRATPGRLHIRTQGAVFVLSSEIPANELEELRVIEPKDDKRSTEKGRIVARSDRTTIEFGHDLSQEKKEWIKTVLETMLTA